MRLFACHCCRRIWSLLTDERSRRAVEISEQYADGRTTRSELSAAHEGASGAATAATVTDYRMPGDAPALFATAAAVCASSRERIANNAVSAASSAHTAVVCARPGGGGKERRFQCELLHDIFGNPFRPVAFSPSWRTDTAVALARQMYGSRNFGAMPILADALQDAGCDNEDVLHHCRETTAAHVRGCWVVDGVLASGGVVSGGSNRLRR
jgi:hypothetical protein